MIEKADEIMFTQNLLLQQMKMAMDRPTISEQLTNELTSMTEADINPAIKILHEWQKNKEASSGTRYRNCTRTCMHACILVRSSHHRAMACHTITQSPDVSRLPAA